MQEDSDGQDFDDERTRAIEDEPDADLHTDLDDFGEGVAESIEEAVRPWRVAESLKALRRQVDAAVPGRSKAGDGTIGDAAHATRSSDHNPWVIDGANGVVTGMDITHDPARGCDAGRLAETLRKSHDKRLKYIISNRRIASAAAKGTSPAWAWRTYLGTNPHNHHCHISVEPTKALFDATGAWAIDAAFAGIEEGVVESAEAAPGEDETLAEIERAAAALAAVSGEDDGRPLLIRLTALREGAEALLARYSETVRARAGNAEEDDPALEAPAPSFEAVRAEYEQLFATCEIPASRASVVAWHRTMLLKGRARYREAEGRTGVPWWFIGLIHAMEAGFSFQGHLHNGDPLTRRTVQVPRGRPPVWNPPSDWLASASDALQHEGFTGANDWSLARALYRLEAYNGWGYRRTGIRTPYLWSFSNQYSKGKYVADGRYDPNAVSKQCGAAVMMKALQKAGDITL